MQLSVALAKWTEKLMSWHAIKTVLALTDQISIYDSRLFIL